MESSAPQLAGCKLIRRREHQANHFLKQTMTTPPKKEDYIDQKDVHQLAGFLYELFESQITRADTKAGLIIAATTVFAAGLILFSKGTLLNVMSATASFSSRLTGLFMVLTFISLALSMIYALLVARPILQDQGTGGTLFFFGKISRMSYPEFVKKFSHQSTEELREALLTEVHNTARLANQKFIRIRHSLDFLIAAVVLWSLVQLMVGLGN